MREFIGQQDLEGIDIHEGDIIRFDFAYNGKTYKNKEGVVEYSTKFCRYWIKLNKRDTIKIFGQQVYQPFYSNKPSSKVVVGSIHEKIAR